MIKDRIVQVLEAKRVPKEKTIKELGVTSANFRSKAKETPINSDVIVNLFAMFPDLNLEWLITGEGEMFKQPAPTDMVSINRYTRIVRENERLRIKLKEIKNG